MMPKIGVFDSGVGGQSVANAIAKAIPDAELLVVDDKEHLPYGTKTPDVLFGFVLPKIQAMATECDVIVIACNTVTTTLISRLRQEVSVPLVGIEPMIKPASQLTKTGVVAVCATPTTLASERYNALKNEWAQGIKVLEPDCSDWAALIEANSINRDHVDSQIETVCDAGADVIVLACTHYHWIEDVVKNASGKRATVLQPESAIIAQLQRVLTK
jgi:glutamate racemase